MVHHKQQARIQMSALFFSELGSGQRFMPDKNAAGQSGKLMPQRFIGEAVRPVEGTGDTARMAVGEPGLPREFVWRGRAISVRAVLRSWRETGRCHHGGPERYVRKHWYEVATASDGTMTLYFDRQPRSNNRKDPRWWLFSIQEDEGGSESGSMEPPEMNPSTRSLSKPPV
jgi:hypothetical protein